MRLRIILPLAATAALAVPAVARADVAHVVAPGESLTSIAAADDLSVSALAAANRLSPDARLLAGSVIRIPPQRAGRRSRSTRSATAPHRLRAPARSRGYVVQPGDTLSAIAARAGLSAAHLASLNDITPSAPLLAGATLTVPGAAGPTSSGAGAAEPAQSHPYVVQLGDTLSAIAGRGGVSVAHLAALNGIDPNAPLLAGATLAVPGAAPAPAHAYVVQPGDTLSAIAARAGLSVADLATLNGIDPTAPLLAGSTLSVPGAAGAAPNVPPYPTPERVTASQVGQVAVANGVPASLAAAIGWQESGFNNDFVSSSDARGVMQILPSTWVWIQNTMTGGDPLAPASAIENVRGGVLLLHSLLVATGDDPALTAAGYYQGLSSVRQYGMFPSTQQYVNDVLALRQRFGGP